MWNVSGEGNKCGRALRTDLFLREVRNVAGHGCRDNQAAASLLLENGTDGLCTMVDASQVSIDDLVPVLHACLQDTSIGCPPGVGDQNVNLAEVLDDVVDQFLHVLEVADIALVSFGLHAVFLLDVFGVLLAALWTGRKGNSYVRTHLRASSSGLGANAGGPGGTGHDDNLALEAQEVMEAILREYLITETEPRER